MKMANLRESLLGFEELVGERIEAVAIGARQACGDLGWQKPVEPLGRDDALALLDYDFPGGMGSQEPPHPVYAWTRSWIAFLNGEEGAAGVFWPPRHPRRCVVEIGGSW